MRGKLKVIIVVMMLVMCIMLPGCGENDNQQSEMKNQILSSDIISQDEFDSGDMMKSRSEVWAYIKLDDKNFNALDDKLGISGWVYEEKFDELAGIYAAYTEDDELGYMPVYAVCIDDENDSLSEEELKGLYFPKDIKLDKIDEDKAKACYIIYSRENSGDIEELGIGVITSDIEWINRGADFRDDETFDLFDSSFEFYPFEGIEVKDYAYAITTDMDSSEYSLGDYATPGDLMTDGSERFVQHKASSESLDNGKGWTGTKLSADADNPLRIYPYLSIYIEKGADKGNTVDFSIKGIKLKESLFKSYDLNHEIVLSAVYMNHRFTEYY